MLTTPIELMLIIAVKDIAAIARIAKIIFVFIGLIGISLFTKEY